VLMNTRHKLVNCLRLIPLRLKRADHLKIAQDTHSNAKTRNRANSTRAIVRR
jgi:hypothetical protein